MDDKLLIWAAGGIKASEIECENTRFQQFIHSIYYSCWKILRIRHSHRRSLSNFFNINTVNKSNTVAFNLILILENVQEAIPC